MLFCTLLIGWEELTTPMEFPPRQWDNESIIFILFIHHIGSCHVHLHWNKHLHRFAWNGISLGFHLGKIALAFERKGIIFAYHLVAYPLFIWKMSLHLALFSSVHIYFYYWFITSLVSRPYPLSKINLLTWNINLKLIRRILFYRVHQQS